MYINKRVKIADILNANFEGYTIDSNLNKPEKRYIVGGFSFEYNFKFCPANLRAQKIFNFVENYFLYASCNPVFFGIWHNKTNKHIYLDICKEFNDLGEALKQGKENQEICIFDNLNKTEIYI